MTYSNYVFFLINRKKTIRIPNNKEYPDKTNYCQLPPPKGRGFLDRGLMNNSIDELRIKFPKLFA